MAIERATLGFKALEKQCIDHRAPAAISESYRVPERADLASQVL